MQLLVMAFPKYDLLGLLQHWVQYCAQQFILELDTLSGVLHSNIVYNVALVSFISKTFSG